MPPRLSASRPSGQNRMARVGIQKAQLRRDWGLIWGPRWVVEKMSSNINSLFCLTGGDHDACCLEGHTLACEEAPSKDVAI